MTMIENRKKNPHPVYSYNRACNNHTTQINRRGAAVFSRLRPVRGDGALWPISHIKREEARSPCLSALCSQYMKPLRNTETLRTAVFKAVWRPLDRTHHWCWTGRTPPPRKTKHIWWFPCIPGFHQLNEELTCLYNPFVTLLSCFGLT